MKRAIAIVAGLLLVFTAAAAACQKGTAPGTPPPAAPTPLPTPAAAPAANIPTPPVPSPTPAPSPTPSPTPKPTATPRLSPTPRPTRTPTPPTPTPVPTGQGQEVWDLGRTWEQKTELSLPFAGVAYVSQGWDGQGPTHYGKWRYALDFIFLDTEGKSHRGDGDKPEDYYIWGTPVLAVAAGRVVAAVDGFSDNPPYQSWDEKAPSGNYVILDHDNGEFSEYSHFQKGSIAVKVGQAVERGQALGLVGNSGYSYEPHIHFQLQDSLDIQATTLPARFAVFYELFRGRVYEMVNRVPLEGEYVSHQRPQ